MAPEFWSSMYIVNVVNAHGFQGPQVVLAQNDTDDLSDAERVYIYIYIYIYVRLYASHAG